MRYTALILILILFPISLFAQTTETDISDNRKSEVKTETKTKKTDEKTELEKAIGLKNAAERIAALQKFIADYPESKEKIRASELIVSARAEIAAEKLNANETQAGVELFKLAVGEAPTPVSDKLFESVILQIPTNVYVRGERIAAFDIAKLIEEKIGDNPKQILGLATFYLGIEYSTAARELAEKAIALEPDSAIAYQTLGLANRVGFNLPNAAEAYARSLELNPDSIVSKRSLAELKRALGNADEAATLYREILAKDKTDIAAKTGLILSLFNSGRQAEAEDEMAESLVDTPNNVPLLVGAAYWYATRNNGAKAIDLATQALKIEPRYTWGYIALARGLMKQNQPIAAETALLNARQFGNFPTISYELALAQSAAGFYKEAAQELKKNFTIENGKVVASLGGRVVAEGDNFIELLSLERKAGIFEPTDANDLETAKKLKQLLEFENKLDAKTPDESEIAIAAENFANGNDSMKTHRDLYAANRLLEKKIALPKALELTKNAVTGVDSAINVPNPTSAVLADELYETRILAKSRGQNVVVPDIPPATLSKIIRGRIEETAGWTLYEQGNYEAALAKLNLAMSILPKDSAWWRSVYWKRGTVFLAMEKPNDALDSYIKSYASEIANSEPSTAKKIVVETLYQQINGSLEGLEEKLVIPVKTSTDTTAVFVQEPVTDKKEEPRQRSNKNVPEIVPIAKSTPKTSPNTAANTAVNKNILENIPEENVATAKTESVPIAVTENIPETTPVPAEFPENPETTLPEEEVLTKEITSIETLPSPILFESTVVKKPTENKKVIVEDPTTGTSLENDTKPLFDPVIIDVPKTDFEKPAKASEKTKNINPESTSNEPAGTTRPRIVVLNNEKTTEVSECGITVSQEVVSIINNGGNLGVLVGLTNGNEPKNIKAVSSSPKDIQILYEPEIGGVAGQGFFLIKSISTNKGAYTVTFDTACGKKEILVKVR